MPSEMLPLTPIGMKRLQLGKGFLVTSVMACSTKSGSLFLASAPYELYTVDVP